MLCLLFQMKIYENGKDSIDIKKIRVLTIVKTLEQVLDNRYIK